MSAAAIPLAMRARLIEQAEAAVRAGDDAAARAALHVYADWLDGQGETRQAQEYRQALAAEDSWLGFATRPQGVSQPGKRCLCLRSRDSSGRHQHWFTVRPEHRVGAVPAELRPEYEALADRVRNAPGHERWWEDWCGAIEALANWLAAHEDRTGNARVVSSPAYDVAVVLEDGTLAGFRRPTGAP